MYVGYFRIKLIDKKQIIVFIFLLTVMETTTNLKTQNKSSPS